MSGESIFVESGAARPVGSPSTPLSEGDSPHSSLLGSFGNFTTCSTLVKCTTWTVEGLHQGMEILQLILYPIPLATAPPRHSLSLGFL